MNEIETRDKGLLLCQNLLDKGVLSQTDFEACSQIYLPSTGLSRAVAGAVQGIPDAKTSAEVSFGMSAKQGKDELGYDVSKRPSYTAFFRLVNSDMYYRQTNRKGVVNAEGTFSDSAASICTTTDIYSSPANIFSSPAFIAGISVSLLMVITCAVLCYSYSRRKKTPCLRSNVSAMVESCDCRIL